MIISAALVKELRERTGAGMMECKKALAEVGGDIEAAITAMRKAGQAKAAKKAGRIAAEGVIVVKTSADNKAALMLEVNCETDFVARDHNFLAFVDSVATAGLAAKCADIDSLLAFNTDSGKTIAQVREDLVAKIGENINLRRVAFVTAQGVVGNYVHGNNRIGVLVALSAGDSTLGKDIAMHIAASKPIAITPEELPADLVAKEKEICLAQVQASGKPPAILEKMIAGRMQKFLNESSLVKQQFVKNPDITIDALLQQAKAKIEQFVRFEVGEGIEKKEVDFAAEVMAQVDGKK